ncbi:MAG: acyl-CoA dehydrogenase family protein [Actinomycetota bacterium]
MDFAFSEEQTMLRRQARDFLADRFPAERVVELAQSDDGWDRSSWKEIADLGWIGLSAPEEAGGAGMSFIDEAVLIEELGAALYPGPYLSTVALALPALARDPELTKRVASGETTATLALEGAAGDDVTATGSNGSWILEGVKSWVPDAAAADVIVVPGEADGGAGLWAVEAQAADIATVSTTDTTRRLGTVRLDGSPGRLLAAPGEADELLTKIRRRALAAGALEAVGIGQRALDLARAYVSERKQFEKPIGSYQAVSHQVADSYVGVELARSLAYWAAWCVAESDEQAPQAVVAAKSLATEVAVSVCERSIQVHGGIGFTWEHILHRYYKRAEWLESFLGFGSQHRAELADSLL